jgi:hypothetical protein
MPKRKAPIGGAGKAAAISQEWLRDLYRPGQVIGIASEN